MKKDKAFLVAYASGLFDGEGCVICLNRTDVAAGNHYRIALQVWMSSYQWVDLFIGLFGGKVRLAYGGTKKPGWIWDLQGLLTVKKVIKIMLPFLRVKKAEAELALRLIDRIIVGNRIRLSSNRIGRGSPKLSDHEYEARQALIRQIKALKDTHFDIPKCIPAEDHKRIRAVVETNYSNSVKSVTLKS